MGMCGCGGCCFKPVYTGMSLIESLYGVPEYLSPNFVERNETRYSIRDSVNKLVVPFPRTNYLKNSFSYSGATLWNSPPYNLRGTKSLSQFRRLLNLHF